MPKVSVIMPAYNAEKYIREAIDSILSQTFKNFEFIILNDCSQDDTENIILSYQDDRIVYLRNEKNMGVAATLNRGLAIAKGEYIARMDADDISMPERFEKQVELLDAKSSVAVCGCAIMLFDQRGDQGIRSFPPKPEQAKMELLYTPCVAHPAVMIRGSTIREHKLTYSLELEGSEDYGLWWEIAKHGDIVSLPACMLRYRVHPNQASRNSMHRRERFRKFADRRMGDLGISLTDEENKLFFQYTCGELRGASNEEMHTFIGVLLKVFDTNCRNRYFDSRECRKSLRQAAFYSVDSAQITDAQKKELYQRLKKNRLSVTAYRLIAWVRALL